MQRWPLIPLPTIASGGCSLLTSADAEFPVACVVGDSDVCACPDGTASQRACLGASEGFGPCQCGVPGGEGEGEPLAPGEGEGEPLAPGEGEGEPLAPGEGEGEPLVRGEGEGEPLVPGEGEGEADPGPRGLRAALRTPRPLAAAIMRSGSHRMRIVGGGPPVPSTSTSASYRLQWREPMTPELAP